MTTLAAVTCDPTDPTALARILELNAAEVDECAALAAAGGHIHPGRLYLLAVNLRNLAEAVGR